MAGSFNIEVWVEVPKGGCGSYEELKVTIDLSNPEFEDAVLAAAGRFRSLKRKKRGGGRPRTYVQCKHGRKVWKQGGKKCKKCEAEKLNEKAGGTNSDGTETHRNRPSGKRLGIASGVEAGKQRQKDKHEDHPEAHEEERLNVMGLPELSGD